MRSLAFAIALLSALSVQADVRVVVLDVRADKAKREVADALSQLVADALAKSPGVQPIGGQELATIVDESARKQLRSCDDDSACIIEIGGAIGADYFLVTSLGAIGSSYVFSARLLSAKSGQVVSRASRQVAKDDDALAPLACPVAQEVLQLAAKKDARVSGDPARCRRAAPPPAPRAKVEPAPKRESNDDKVIRVQGDERVTITLARPAITLGLRGDVDLRGAEWGAALGATAIVGRRWAGVVSLLTNTNVTALRLEGRASLPLGQVRGYGSAGLAIVGGAVGLRASAGAELPLDDLRLFADAAVELFAGGNERDSLLLNPVLLGAGIGYVF